jgi:hypothetical protein
MDQSFITIIAQHHRYQVGERLRILKQGEEIELGTVDDLRAATLVDLEFACFGEAPTPLEEEPKPAPRSSKRKTTTGGDDGQSGAVQ